MLELAIQGGPRSWSMFATSTFPLDAQMGLVEWSGRSTCKQHATQQLRRAVFLKGMAAEGEVEVQLFACEVVVESPHGMGSQVNSAG